MAKLLLLLLYSFCISCAAFVVNSSTKQVPSSFLHHRPYLHSNSKCFLVGRGVMTSTQKTCLAANNGLQNLIGSPELTDETGSLSKFASWSPTFDLDYVEENELELQEGQRLVCVGDIHGDFKALQELLSLAGVYKCADNDDDDDDENKNTQEWIGGNTILVQCGDVLDCCSQELECLALLAKLSREARKDGGKVIVLWGDHEVFNACSCFMYAPRYENDNNDKYEETFGKVLDKAMKSDRWRQQFAVGLTPRLAAYEPDGLLAKPYLAQLKVAVKVGKTICVHGGLSTHHLDAYQNDIGAMNQAARNFILGRWFKGRNFGFDNETCNRFTWRRRIVQSALPSCLKEYDNDLRRGVPWLRTYSFPLFERGSTYFMLNSTLDRLQVDRMVVGHTIQSKINADFDDKVWRIDVGVGYNQLDPVREVLEIVNSGGKEVVSILTPQGSVPAVERRSKWLVGSQTCQI